MPRKNVNKSAWIRAQPYDMPANDVVALGAKKGIIVNSRLVNVVRSNLRRELWSRGAPLPKGLERQGREPYIGEETATAPAERPATPDEALLCELAMRVGFTRALAVLNGFRENCLATLKARPDR